jgi:hypothetical protein
MSGAGPAKTAEIAASVETFVREIVIPYEKILGRVRTDRPTIW